MSQKPTQTAHPKNQLETSNQFPKISFTEMFWVFFKLGLTSFGGPIAHIGYFQKLFVEQKKLYKNFPKKIARSATAVIVDIFPCFRSNILLSTIYKRKIYKKKS